MSDKKGIFGFYTSRMNAMLEEQSSYVESMTSEWTRAREQGMAQTRSAMEEYASLIKLSFQYQADLAKEMQQMSADAVREATKAMTPSA